MQNNWKWLWVFVTTKMSTVKEKENKGIFIHHFLLLHRFSLNVSQKSDCTFNTKKNKTR